jgi:hypothetical protein
VPPQATRFNFKIAAWTPTRDLLPTPPRAKKITGPVVGDDLTRVPEVTFQARPRDPSSAEATKRTAHTIAKINHLNAKKEDGFLKALIGERTDLVGLPLAMGDACRTKGERSKQFAIAVNMIRQARRGSQPVPVAVPVQVPSTPLPAPTSATTPAPSSPGATVTATTFVVETLTAAVTNNAFVTSGRAAGAEFWTRYQAACAEQDREVSRIDRACQEHVILARIAALMQVLAPESPETRLGLVKYLSTISHVEATRALAKLAIFSSEDGVREAAVDALKVRRERDYTDVLVKGLSYPWPAVARRAADAVVKLERHDLLPQLVSVLEEPDPRAPRIEEVERKKVPVVRELVRINHHQNCLLCHAPGNTGKVSPETITAEVPIPNEPLPSDQDGYRNQTPDILVRIDVTYLRQDFSAFQAVADANPWPEMQRFDFLVRKRILSEEEATAYQEKLQKKEPGELSPYHRAALAALREMTGKDTEPTPAAWRKLLKLPAERE